MSAQTATNDLREALARLPDYALAADRAALGPLHEKVCAVVNELKATGMQPEHVLLAVKRIAFGVLARPSANILIEKMTKWCLEQYFKEQATGEGAGPPR